MANGTATRISNAARDDARLVINAALDVWNKRVETARETGKKLQQGPFSIKTEDGQTTWLVRPLRTGLEFYSRCDWGVEFEMPKVEPKTNIVGLEDKPSRPRRKRTKRSGK